MESAGFFFGESTAGNQLIKIYCSGTWKPPTNRAFGVRLSFLTIRDSPVGRPIRPLGQGKIVTIPAAYTTAANVELPNRCHDSTANSAGTCPAYFTTGRSLIVLRKIRFEVDYSRLTRVG